MLKTKVKAQGRRREDVSPETKELDRVAISVKSHKLLNQLTKRESQVR